MPIIENVTRSEISAQCDLLKDEWDKSHKMFDATNTIAKNTKAYEHSLELYGAYMATARLIGVVTDEQWQEFLAGKQ